jgi:uncharacterized protein YndB with AHSA1/START domain
MSDPSFSTTFTVAQTPAQVFSAINDVRAWWSGEIDGATNELGAEFTYRYEDVHRSTQQIVELVPDEKVVWLVTDGYLQFVDDKTEWTGTSIVFEIEPRGEQTELRFRHVGLLPDSECYQNCSTAWAYYINTSLRALIATGKGQPNQ